MNCGKKNHHIFNLCFTNSVYNLGINYRTHPISWTENITNQNMAKFSYQKYLLINGRYIASTRYIAHANNGNKLFGLSLILSRNGTLAGLSYGFELSVALILTPVTNFLLYGWIVSTTGKITHNIEAHQTYSAIAGITGYGPNSDSTTWI